MKNLVLSLLLVSAIGSLTGCKEDSKIPAPAVTSVPVIFGKVSSDINKSYYNTRRAAASINNLPTTVSNPDPTLPPDPFIGQRPVFEFSFDIPDQRDVNIAAVEVYKSFKRGITIGPRAFVGAYTSFPATVTLNSQDALTGLQRLFTASGATGPTASNLLASTPGQQNQILSGDQIVFTYEYVLQDGSRVILTPLTDVTLNDKITKVKVISGNQINPPYAVYATFQVL